MTTTTHRCFFRDSVSLRARRRLGEVGWLVAVMGILRPISSAPAEPMFLAKQYTRCTACHYSPTGGGLLTPYGRLLSHRELSTTGATGIAPAAGEEDAPRGEQGVLYGAPRGAPRPAPLGPPPRPSPLRHGVPGGHTTSDLRVN